MCQLHSTFSDFYDCDTEHRKPSASHSHRVNVRRYYVRRACDSLDRCRFAATHFRLMPIVVAWSQRRAAPGPPQSPIVSTEHISLCGHFVGHSIGIIVAASISRHFYVLAHRISHQLWLAQRSAHADHKSHTADFSLLRLLAIGFSALRPFNVLGDRDTWCADK